MKDLRKVKKGITHAGRFHTDDILSTVLIKFFNPEIVIERVVECNYDDTDDDVIIYDIGRGEFDHHQEIRELNEFGIYYSAFGKLWRTYGKELLKQRGFKKIDEAFSRFNRFYVLKVDEGDNNGYKHVKHFIENKCIVDFNPTWYEVKSNTEIENIQFEKAVSFATNLFDNWLRNLYTQIEMTSMEENIWHDAIENMEDGIINLKEEINWRHFFNNEFVENLRFVITPNKRGGYSLVTVNEQEILIVDSEYLTFLHPSKWIAATETIEDAYQAAKQTLYYYGY